MTRVVIRGLPVGFVPTEVQTICNEAGLVTAWTPIASLRAAIAPYATEEAAPCAVRNLNGRSYGGATLSFEMAAPMIEGELLEKELISVIDEDNTELEYMFKWW